MQREIWIADDDTSMLWVLAKALSGSADEVREFEDAESLLQALETARPDLIITDIHMPGYSGFELLEQVNEMDLGIPVIVITAFGDLDSAVDAYKFGAYEYLTKPFDVDELVAIVSKALEAGKPASTESEIHRSEGVLVGDSPPMQKVFRIIGRIAQSNMGVLIRGESGTGKELIAGAIYANSGRSDQPFVAINTAAIPAELLESELFGHEKGAFTGAHSTHIGRFEQANGGTLFLDEIGDMPLSLQTRLLRVLSEGRFYRVGGRDEIQVDVRVISATNQDLEQLVSQGEFRNDLYHRLNVLSVDVPALRDRAQDIPVLVQYFLEMIVESEGSTVKNFSASAMEALQSYSWPGNVRELGNTVYQLVILSPGTTIRMSDLPDRFQHDSKNDAPKAWKSELSAEIRRRLGRGESGSMSALGEEIEKLMLEQALAHTDGRKLKAAELLGVGRNTLTRKLKEHNMQNSG